MMHLLAYHLRPSFLQCPLSRDCVSLVDSVTYDRSMSLPAFPHDTTSNIDKFSFEHLKDRDFFMQLSICTYILRKLYEHWESTLLQGHISRPTTSKYDVTHYCQDISVPTEEFLDSLIPPPRHLPCSGAMVNMCLRTQDCMSIWFLPFHKWTLV